MSSITLPSAKDIAEIAGVSNKPIQRRLTVRNPAGKRSETFVTVEHKTDPKADILERIGPLPDGIVHGCRIMVAIYHPPVVEKTAGGLFLAKTIQDEDRLEFLHQGKVGLVVAMGPDAYVDTDDVKFTQKIEVGDWVWFRPSDGLPCDVQTQFCRVFDSERFIIGRLPHPDMAS